GQDHPVRSKAESTLTGRSLTTSSPGTPLRLPNCPARSAPIYRAAIAVAVRTSSAGSSDSSASPWTWTNAYGGSSRSTHRLARGSRASARPFAVSRPVLNTRLSPSTTNQTGATSGRPLAAREASLPVRVPCARKALTSGSLRDATLGADHVHGRDGHDAVPLRHGGILVDVELDDVDLVRVLSGDLLQHRGDHAARAAPFGPVIHDDRLPVGAVHDV